MTKHARAAAISLGLLLTLWHPILARAVNPCALVDPCSGQRADYIIDRAVSQISSYSGVYVDPTAPSVLKAATWGAITHWNDATGLHLNRLDSATAPIVVVAVFSGFSPPSYESALAYWDQVGSIRYIYVDFELGMNWGFSCGDRDLESVLVHELGHVLGLKHYSVDEYTDWLPCGSGYDGREDCTVMTKCKNPTTCERDPQSLDKLAIFCLYGVITTTWGEVKKLYGPDYLGINNAVALAGDANTIVWRKTHSVANGYSVYRSEANSTEAQLIGTVSSDDSVFADDQTVSGKRYDYHIAAVGGSTLMEIGSPSAGLKLVSDFVIGDMPWNASNYFGNNSALAVRGAKVYAALETSYDDDQIRTYDVSNPTHVVELGRHTGLGAVRMICLSEDGTKLYAVVSTGAPTSLLILDTTQPNLPLLQEVTNVTSGVDGYDVYNVALDDDVVYIACGRGGVKAIAVDHLPYAGVVGTYNSAGSGSSRTTTDVQLIGNYIYTQSQNYAGHDAQRCDRVVPSKSIVFGHLGIVTFASDCNSNQSCWANFAKIPGLFLAPGRGHFAVEKTASANTPYQLTNMIVPQSPVAMRTVDAPASGPSMILRDPSTNEPVDTLKFFSTFDSIDFDSRFAYATTPLFQDPYDRGLVVFDLWGSGSALLYATGDRLGYGGTATVRSQGKYVYLLDTFYQNGELHSNKARLRIYEKASGGQPDPEHPVRIFPVSDAYKLGQDVGISLAVGCPTSVHIELLEDGSVVGQVSTQNFAIADDVARFATWPIACSSAHLENHSYTFRATATYANNSTSSFSSPPFRIEVGAKREVAVGGGKPFTSIQAAVDASASGDTVVVYSGSYNEALTLKSNVRVVGKTGASIVAGTTGPAVTVSGAVFPPIVDGLEFHAAAGATTGAISVTGCGIQVKNCTFNSLYRAVSVSSGHATFTSCTFANNHDTAGFGAAVWLDADALQPTTFTDCQFTGNSVSIRGGAVYIGSTGAYNASAPQISFVRCAFTGNSAPEGAAVRIGVNRRPLFDHCTFSNNDPTATSGAYVVGGAGGVSATFQNCTFASNTSAQSYDLIRLEPGGTVPLPTVDATIFANNSSGNALGTSYGGTYAVAHSDFFGNSSGDATWATNGTGNFSDNPAFCPSGDYSIYAFSPCVPGIKYANLVGAKDVSCVPNATVTVLPGGTNPPDNYLLACPKGDGDSLAVQVALDPSVMTRAPEARELTIQAPYKASGIYSDKTITSDVAATAPNYVMRIGHKYISGYTWLPLTVYLNGHPLAQTALVKRRSPDIAGPDGAVPDGRVSLSDYSRWIEGWSYAGHTVPYDSLSDIDADHVVNNVDFGKFCMHYNQHPEHDEPFSLPTLQMTFPSQTAVSSAHVTMQFTEEYVTSTDRRLNVDLALEEATGATACIFAVKTNRNDLRFLNWEKANPNIIFANVNVDSVEQLYVGTGYPSAYAKTKESLGRLVFDVDGDAPINIADDQFILTVGDIELMGMDNQTYGAQLRGVMGRTINGSVQKLFHNRLEQNFPNPFNPQTTIAFSIHKASNVHLGIYDVTGSRVRDLVDEKRVPGVYRIVWDGRNQNGNPVASGVYFYKLTAGEFTSAKKMVLLK